MIKTKILSVIFGLFLCVLGCVFSYGQESSSSSPNLTEVNMDISIIPKPTIINRSPGVFEINPTTRIRVDPFSDEIVKIAEYFSAVLSEVIGHEIQIEEFNKERVQPGSILLAVCDAKEPLGDESYKLIVTSDAVEVRASRPAGLFYGIQTLRQLFSSSTEEPGNGPHSTWKILCVEIEDIPRYRWRGMLLDCSRHFMSTEFIKRYIDLIAYHKLNVLHLHLTDDQGWRIQVRKYPKLTEIGAYRGEGDNRYGGYYTQDEIKGIVAYAKSRYVNVVPEFEMPGHASSAIASYPELSCHGNRIPVATDWGVFEDVFCPGKESTFEFLEGVLTEVIEIFPSPYIHIGGDEAPRKNWEQCAFCQKRIKDENLKGEDELQSYLIRRIEQFLSQHGRRLIGWDEILRGGGLPKSAIVQSWRGMDGAITGAKLGHDIISSPNQYVYFDYPQEEEHSKPDWMSVTTLEEVYSFDPTPSSLAPAEAKHILGAECTMWTEHATQEEVDQQLFPRLCAFSEVVWSPADGRNWDDFTKRMESHYQRLLDLGVDYYRR